MVDTGDLRCRVSVALRLVQSPVFFEMKKCVRALTDCETWPRRTALRKGLAVGGLNTCLFLF